MKHSDVLAGKWDWLAEAILKRRVVGFQNPAIPDTTKTTELVFDSPPEAYRVINTPIYRPFKYGEIPVGAVVRFKEDKLLQKLVTEIGPHWIALSGMLVNYEHLLGEYEKLNTTFGTEEWVPCGMKE